MKRNKFIAALLAATIAPLTILAENNFFYLRTNKGFKIDSGEGRIHRHLKKKR